MGVRKIFTVLVTIVVCVIIGAFVINTLMPNAVKSLINATEDMIYNATGMSFNFNNDDHAGQKSNSGTAYTGTQQGSQSVQGGSTVEGWGNGTSGGGGA